MVFYWNSTMYEQSFERRRKWLNTPSSRQQLLHKFYYNRNSLIEFEFVQLHLVRLYDAFVFLFVFVDFCCVFGLWNVWADDLSWSFHEILYEVGAARMMSMPKAAKLRKIDNVGAMTMAFRKLLFAFAHKSYPGSGKFTRIDHKMV